jgi:uncharacterized protein YbaR (Trm112 family)
MDREVLNIKECPECKSKKLRRLCSSFQENDISQTITCIECDKVYKFNYTIILENIYEIKD